MDEQNQAIMPKLHKVVDDLNKVIDAQKQEINHLKQEISSAEQRMENKFSEERKIYEQKIAEEKLKTDATKTEFTSFKAAYEQEMLKMKKELSIIEPFGNAAFNDSGILTTEAQRKFVRYLFIGRVFSGQVTRLYKASEHGFAGS